MSDLYIYLQRRRGVLALLTLFISFRFLSLLLFRPGGFIADFSDYDFYRTWGLLTPAGYEVYENLWTAYPPLFPRMMLSLFDLSAQIPPWSDPRLWFHLFLGSALLLFETGNLLLIYRIGNRLGGEAESEPSLFHGHGDRGGLNRALIYALFFAPVYTLLGWFEPMPLFFLLLGLEMLLVGRRHEWGWVGSAISAALGFLTKLTPALLLPIAARQLGARLRLEDARRHWFRPGDPHNLLRPALYATFFLGTVIILGLALTWNNPALALSPFRVQSIRPPWQSIWALLDGYTGYGLVPLDMRNLDGLDNDLWRSRLPWGLITVLFGLLYLWLYTRRYDWTRVRTPVALTAVSVIWLFLYSKGWSPQFVVWILAFLALLMPGMTGILIGIALTVLNAIESQIYLIILPEESWLLWGTVILRTLLLILLGIQFGGQIWPSENRERVLLWNRRLMGATLAFGLVAGLFAVPTAGRAYAESRLAVHPCRAAIEKLQSESDWPERTVVVADQEIWAALNPWLANDYDLSLIDTYAPGREAEIVGAERLSALGAERSGFWWVDNGDEPTFLLAYRNRADVHTFSEFEGEECRLLRLFHLPELPLGRLDVAGGPVLLHAVFTDVWEERDVGSGVTKRWLHVVLYWQAQASIAESYTVFVHVVDEDEALVAQKDNLPVGGLAPTTTWTSGALVRDSYRIELPTDSLSGSYRLLLGMYTDEGRVPIVLRDGANRTEVVIPLNHLGE